MCGVPQAQLALTAISAVGQVQEYREQKALAASKRASQNQTRINANIAYMRDINKIDQEKVQADQEKAVAEFKTKQESKKKLAQALNLNAGNAVAIVQDIGSLYNDEYTEIMRDYKGDMITLAGQTTLKAPFGSISSIFCNGPNNPTFCWKFANFLWHADGPYSPCLESCVGVIFLESS